jgi:hypothetical protein
MVVVSTQREEHKWTTLYCERADDTGMLSPDFVSPAFGSARSITTAD